MLSLVLTVPASEVELASDALWALGVVAVEERDAGGSGTEDHFVELWTSLGDDTEAIATAAEAFPKRWRWHLVEVDESVSETWREHAVPTWVESDLVITPAWVDVDVPSTTTVLRIEPGASFGLGDHPTTVLSMRAMRTAVFQGATVLDVGCGSGILSIGAVALGASRAEAIDISPAAVTATRENAAMNGVHGEINVSLTPLAEIEGTFDLVLANILAPALIELAPDLKRVLAPSGVLILSGLLADRHEHVEAALEPLQRVDRQVREGWCSLSLRW